MMGSTGMEESLCETNLCEANQNMEQLILNGNSTLSGNNTWTTVIDTIGVDENKSWETVLRDGTTISWYQVVFAGVFIILTLELLAYVEKNGQKWFNIKYIPCRGKHLDDFTPYDDFCIKCNKLGAVIHGFVALRYLYFEENLIWGMKNVSFLNILLPVIICYYVYDFFFYVEHLLVHIRGIYELIHKHHHRQQAPTRGNEDAMNVHPIEYFMHRYTHILTVFLVSRLVEMHLLSAFIYQLSSGLLSCINHTRLDVSLVIYGHIIYESKMHDIHHRFPRRNYGFYTTFWDKLFGTYRSYDEDVAPLKELDQIDPKTGKSYRHARKMKLKATKEK